MKKVNFTHFVFCLLVFFAFQAQAQYSGVAYLGNTPQIGETVGTPVKIELENFDALASDPNGDGANYVDAVTDLPAGGTYRDRSPGGSSEGNPIRTSSDVDLEAAATGAVLATPQGQEFTVYTVNVVNPGTYHMGVNYIHGGSSKDIRLSYYSADGTGRVDLHDTLDDDGLPATGGEYITTDNLGSFYLPAGTLLLRFLHLDAGPRFDFFTLTLDEIDMNTSTEETLKANALKVFPNPADNGIFIVNTDDEWEVYSMAGNKVLEGVGNKVDLSNFSEGVYILKTPYASMKLFSKQ
jgi:hypothetical protein